MCVSEAYVSPTVFHPVRGSAFILRTVYNQDNRFKVSQDEAKAKEAEDAEEERHQQVLGNHSLISKLIRATRAAHVIY